MPTKKLILYARSHDEKGRDKVLVMKDTLKLPEGDVPEGASPDFTIYDVLESLTGLGVYPDHRPKGAIRFTEPDFIIFPYMEGKVITPEAEILCYSVEVNELRPLKDNVIWMPWWTLRLDSRVSTMSRFVIALLYAQIRGWEIKLDDQGNWTLPYFCTEGRENIAVDEILSGRIKMDVHDSFEDYIKKCTDRWLAKEKVKESKEKAHIVNQDNWLFRILRRWGMLI